MADATLLAQVADTIRAAARLQPGMLIPAHARLVEDLAIDSLDLVGVYIEIQDRFGVAIEDDDIPKIRRVADLVAYVDARRGAAAA